MSTESANPAVPPKLVRLAFRLWLAAAVIVIVVGILTLIVNGTVTGFLFGIFFIVIGVVIGILARQAYPGDPRWRSSLSVLLLVLTALSLFGSVVFGPALALVLLGSIIGLAGSMAAYRPASEPWFAEK